MIIQIGSDISNRKKTRPGSWIFQDTLEEEENAKAVMMRQLSRSNAESALWRKKYENESLAKIEELESSKTKLQIRLAEASKIIEELRTKLEGESKARQRLQTDLSDSQVLPLPQLAFSHFIFKFCNRKR